MSYPGQVAHPFVPLNKRTVRAPVNPLDKATVVSIYPRDINEKKHTIQPGHFKLPAGSFTNPTILVVGPSSWWKVIDEEQPILEIPTSSIQIADSLVRDYCNGILGCDMHSAMPGLFFVNGEKTLNQIRKEYPAELDKALAKQRRWYEILIRMADTLWARSNGNPLVVSDDMRLAAKENGVEANKDWMKDFQMIDMVRCKACGSLKNPTYPVCSSCHFPDPDHPMTAGLLAAKAAIPIVENKGQ